MVSWGLKSKGKAAAFRPAMSLASGELSGVKGKFLCMTATATSQTIRLLIDQLPELKNWEVILNSPLRNNVTLVIPAPECVSFKYQTALEPFISRINEMNEFYLVLVRGEPSFDLHICNISIGSHLFRNKQQQITNLVNN